MKALYTEKTVEIPEQCEVSFEDDKFTFTGPLGSQVYDVSKLKLTFEIKKDVINVKCWHCNRQKLQLIQTIASHLRNYMKGVTVGFKYILRSVFRHFPIQISINKEGKEIKVLSFLGSKEERTYPVRGSSIAIPGEVKDTIVIQGINLNDVSQTAASVSSDSLKRKKHDERIFVDGIYVLDRASIVQE